MKPPWEVIRELREDRDIKQETVAELLQTTQQYYSRYERGVHPLPIQHRIALCKVYNVSANYILGLRKDEPVK